MITIEWNILVYGIVVILSLCYLIFADDEESGGYISIPIVKPFLFIGLIIYTLIWGGIFWW